MGPAPWPSDAGALRTAQPEALVETKQGVGTGSRDAADLSTLYVGNLHPCVTVTALQEICTYFGAVEQVKVIKDKNSGQSAGYGFVKFVDRRCADLALGYLQGKVFYGQELRVNWAFQSHQREDTSTHFHIFVGDLGQEVTDAVLFNAFSLLPGCSDARVMWDHSTGRSKGYGFVSLRSKEDAQRAIEKMHGQVIGSRRVRCGWAQHKQEAMSQPMDFNAIDKADPLNTNVYVGNIAPEWLDHDIQQHFAGYGPVAEVKLHKKGGYGFLRYERHEDAVRAIVENNGTTHFGRVIKCSWGKNSSTMGGMTSLFGTPAAAAVAPLMMAGLQPMAGVMGGAASILPSILGPQAMVLPSHLQTGGGALLAGQPFLASQMLGAPSALSSSQMLLMGGQPGGGGVGGGPSLGGAIARQQYFSSDGATGMYYPTGGLYYQQ